jgi:hypothetical protein
MRIRIRLFDFDAGPPFTRMETRIRISKMMRILISNPAINRFAVLPQHTTPNVRQRARISRPSFRENKPKNAVCSHSVENERFELVFAKTRSINSGRFFAAPLL